MESSYTKKLILVDPINSEYFTHDTIPQNLEQLQSVEDKFRMHGTLVSFFFQSKSSDGRLFQKEISCFKDFKEACSADHPQGVILFVEQRKNQNQNLNWKCRGCFYGSNTYDKEECLKCGKRIRNPLPRKIRD